MPIRNSGLPNRPRRWLQVAGIGTVGELLSYSEAELLTIRNFGQTSLGHVQRFLRRHDLQLRPAQDESLEPEQIRAALGEGKCRLTRRERAILKLRHGLSNGHALTLEQTGRRFGLTRERVRQIQKKAEQKVHARLTRERSRGEQAG